MEGVCIWAYSCGFGFFEGDPLFVLLVGETMFCLCFLGVLGEI